MTRDQENTVKSAWFEYIDACIDARRHLFQAYLRAFNQPHASNLITNGNSVPSTLAMMYQTTHLPGLPGLVHFPLMLRELNRGPSSIVIVGSLYEQGLVEKNGANKDQVFHFDDILDEKRVVDLQNASNILLIDDIYYRKHSEITCYELMRLLFEKLFPKDYNHGTHIDLIVAE